MASRIIIIEDKAAVAQDIQNMLIELGYAVPAAVRSVEEIVPQIIAHQPDLVLMNVAVKQALGSQAIRYIRQDLDIPIVYLAASAEDVAFLRAANGHSLGCILEPVHKEILATSIELALYAHTLEKKLEESAQELAELQVRNEELDAFAHSVVHSLSNPLEVITGYTDVLKDYATLPEASRRKYLLTIARNGRKMSNIVKELFLLAGVRKMDVPVGPLDMGSIVAEAQLRLIDMIEERGAEIIVPSTWPAALGYAPWIEEVWVNYISNAIKYGGQPPYIVLGATCLPAPHTEGEKAGQGYVRFWVHDNGPGIALEDQAKLFTPFTRLDQVRAKGHGLGLSIVLRIVEKLGGQAGVESSPGSGSRFSFTLPAAPDD